MEFFLQRISFHNCLNLFVIKSEWRPQYEIAAGSSLLSKYDYGQLKFIYGQLLIHFQFINLLCSSSFINAGSVMHYPLGKQMKAKKPYLVIGQRKGLNGV